MTNLIVFSIVLGILIPAMSAANLTSITWAHAVNNQSFLEHVLSSDIQFIEADIVLGTIINDRNATIQPIMGHPPAITSDITLHTFLTTILEFNREKDKPNRKGVKLDFKSIEVFEGSLDMLTTLWESMNYPVWINADIIPGPVNTENNTAVNSTRFLTGCKLLTSSTLSIGWTTRWGSNFTEGSYTNDQIDQMISAIKENGMNSSHPITFPVRAGIAAQSEENLHRLANAINETNDVTLTIWSSANDAVNIDLLRKLIFSFGLDKVYVDVPEDLSSRLDLGNAPGRASSLIHFGMISVLMLLTSFVFSNCQFSS